ncbi:MAG TPA: YsnF/AvaK domain-containing protein [Ramlibacter sp.]|nr:YsnF/AvaK domain-containing protein [Ramlibacter sp.]
MQTVIGAFEDRDAAQRAVERLVDAGFYRDDVHVQEGASASATGANRTGGVDRTDDEHGMMASIRHFFASLFGDDSPAGRSGLYSEAVRRGTSVVVVDARDDDRAERAASVLHELGAIDVDERAQQWRAEGWTGYSEPQAQPLSTSNNLDAQRALDKGKVQAGTEGVMEVVQEELQIGKRSMDRGGVRVIQRVSEKPVRELVRLREERAVVDRRPVDREATAEDLASFKEGSIELRETAEEPVVAKKARVVEEVRVGKDVREREQPIEDSVRRKDVDVERIEGQGTDRTERERALASDRSADVPLESRDPDALGTEVPATGRKTSKVKPKRNI